MGILSYICKKYRRPTDLTEVEVLKSIALYRLKECDKAVWCLADAIKGVQRYGFIRIFSDEAKDIWPVIVLVSQIMTGEYTQKIIASCQKAMSVK